MSDLVILGKGASFKPQSTSPLIQEGDLYFDSVSKKFIYHNGAAEIVMGSGSTVAGTLAPADGFDALIVETFVDAGGSAASKIDSSITTAAQNVGKGLYRLLCNKTSITPGLTLSTTGTAYTLAVAPSFSLVAGDIIYHYNSNAFRTIQTVLTSTTGVLDAAFVTNLAGQSCMVSQAIRTKDLINFGSALEKDRLRDTFGTQSHSLVNVSYLDSLALGDEIPDFVDNARISAVFSNSGLISDVGFPLSTTFTSIYNRPLLPNQITNISLLNNATKERLFATFFCNPTELAITDANLLEFRISAYVETGSSLINGGVLDSAFCFTDGSGTPKNCSNPTYPSGKTRIVLNWTYTPGINGTDPDGDIEVIVEGMVIPRYYVGIQGAYWQEINPTTIDLYTDLNAFKYSVHIRRRQGSIDTNSVNSAKLLSFYDAIVGSTAEVASGVAQYDNLQAAHNAVPTKGTILVLKSATTGPLIISKNVSIFGQGWGSQISAAVQLQNTANFCTIKNVRFMANVTVDVGSIGHHITDVFVASGFSINDANPFGANNIVDMEE
jgi:hypothetical protein